MHCSHRDIGNVCSRWNVRCSWWYVRRTRPSPWLMEQSNQLAKDMAQAVDNGMYWCSGCPGAVGRHRTQTGWSACSINCGLAPFYQKTHTSRASNPFTILAMAYVNNFLIWYAKINRQVLLFIKEVK